MQAPLKLLTITWSGDKTAFSMLRTSLQHSALAHLPHDVIVQQEDLPHFDEFAGSGLTFYSSDEFLPVPVEQKRLQARHWQEVGGRRLAVLAGSIVRRTGWPDWARHTGWHTQQLCKLAYVAASDTDIVVVMDSDLIVTQHAQEADFLAASGIVCYQDWLDLAKIRGKVLNWHRTTHALFDCPFPQQGALDCYFDTPTVMHAPTVRAMLTWLEKRYHKPWWRVFLDMPPRRWSEFGCYKFFLRHLAEVPNVDWRDTEDIQLLSDARDKSRLLQEFDHLVNEKHCHYVTIHSQSSGHNLWKAEDYADDIRRRIV